MSDEHERTYEVRPSADHPGSWVIWHLEVDREVIGGGAFATREDAERYRDRLVSWQIKEQTRMYELGVSQGRASAERYGSTAERQYGLAHYAARGKLRHAAYERGIHDGIEQVMRDLGEL